MVTPATRILSTLGTAVARAARVAHEVDGRVEQAGTGIARLVRSAARMCADALDPVAIEGAVRGVGVAARLASALVREAQTGRFGDSALAVVLGLIVLTAFALWW